MKENYTLIKQEAGEKDNVHELVTNEKRKELFKSVISSVNKEAHGVWAEIYSELKGIVTPGNVIVPEVAENGFTPSCGWPEFMEKVWLMKHYLDQVERLCKE